MDIEELSESNFFFCRLWSPEGKWLEERTEEWNHGVIQEKGAGEIREGLFCHML